MDGSDIQSWNPNIGSQNKKALQICIYALGKCCYQKASYIRIQGICFINSRSLGTK